MNGKFLFMTITNEQGPARKSQVQPSASIWELYFGVRVLSSKSHTFRLERSDKPEAVVTRKAVRHDHNRTIEIPGVSNGDILHMENTGRNSYTYSILKPKTAEYKHAMWLLKKLGRVEKSKSKYKSPPRRWIVI